MPDREGGGLPPGDPSSGGRAFGPSPFYLAVALGVVALSVVYGWGPASALPEPRAVGVPLRGVANAASTTPQRAMPVAASGVAAPSAPAPLRAEAGPGPAPEGDADPTPDLTVHLNPGEKPTMNEVIHRLHRAGVATGVAAFSPPGTRPPLVGLAVPEDFVLPPGYVRHHQTTDDGQDIEPVLMYAPDHPRFVDAARQPIGTARDRIVPPEQAPPGLPLRRVVVPAPTDGRPGS